MNCFFKGALGAISVLLIFVIVFPQYSDYRAKAETNNWLAQVQPLQLEIESIAKEQKSLSNLKKKVKLTEFGKPHPSYFEVTDTGLIILGGGRDGQVVFLIPSFSENKTTWLCLGGSSKAVPENCKIPNP